MKNKFYPIILSFLVTVLLFISMFWIADRAMQRRVVTQTSTPRAGSAQNGTIALVATSSTITVGPGNATRIFYDTPFCDARVISTVGQPIMLTFSATSSTSTLVPSATVGHEQLASTTVAYDSGLYGCGAFSAYGYGASSTITVSESR